MALSQKQVDDLIVALLSINKYTVTMTWNLLPRFRDAGLTNPRRVAEMDEGTLLQELKRAGYDRGKITDIIAPRLRNLMVCIRSGDLDTLPTMVGRDDEESVKAKLREINGVGPLVAATAWLLLSSSTSST